MPNIVHQLHHLREKVDLLRQAVESDAPSALKDRERKKARLIADELGKDLQGIAREIDTIRQPEHVFDPSDPFTMGELIAGRLLIQRRHELARLGRFYGSGVYALYYRGEFPAYQPISGIDYPLYVGKVDPANVGAKSSEEQGQKLWHRLVKDHGKSIDKAENLRIDDFDCRYMVVHSAWQSTAEYFLIDWFKPVWNNETSVCYGIGKHGDSASTRGNTRSPWDELHPGRPWAAESRAYPGGPDAVARAIEEHFRTHPPE